VAPSLGNRAYRAKKAKMHILELKKTNGQKERDENKYRIIQHMNYRSPQIHLCATQRGPNFWKIKYSAKTSPIWELRIVCKVHSSDKKGLDIFFYQKQGESSLFCGKQERTKAIKLPFGDSYKQDLDESAGEHFHFQNIEGFCH